MGNWLDLVPALLTGSGLTALFNYFINSQKNKKDEFETIVTQWKLDNERLRHEAEECKTNISKINQELDNLRSKLIILENSNFEIPLPMWLQDGNTTILACNKAFEDIFLIPNNKSIHDAVGHMEKEIFPNMPEANILNNLKVIRESVVSYFVEEYPFLNDQLVSFHVIKYPQYVGNVRIGISCIVIPQKWN